MSGSGTLFHYFGDKRSIMVSLFADDMAAQRRGHRRHSTTTAALAEIWRLLDHLCRDVGDPVAPGLVVAMLQLAVSDEDFAGLLGRE